MAEIPPISGVIVTFIPQPINESDSILSKTISIYNQEIKVDVYNGYVVMGAEYWFNNSTDHPITLYVGIREWAGKNFVSKFYWVRIKINNAAPFGVRDTTILYTNGPFTATDTTFPDTNFSQPVSHYVWHYWKMSFQPGITGVSLNYGLRTGGAYLWTGADSIKRNAFGYSFSDYRLWGGGSSNGEIWLRMNDGYTTKDILGLLPDKKFLAGNSILHAAMKDVINDSTWGILLWYRKLDYEGIDPSHVSWEKQFYKVNDWVVNEKILATLSPFSATDYEGKAFQHEVQSASSLLRWSVIAGVIIVAVLLILFVYADRKKTA